MDFRDESKMMYRLKALALVSIVMAHSPYTELENAFVVIFMQRFSTVGVIIFFFLSGYYYSVDGKNHKYSLGKFWKRKIKGLIIPWFINGSLYFGLLTISGTKHMSGIEYINFILGNGSVLYFLTMLCLCYLLCWHLLKKEKFLWSCVFLTLLSVVFTGYEKTAVLLKAWNPYMNILNWIGFFALGILAKQNNWNVHLNRIADKRIARVVVILCGVIALALTIADNNHSYWSMYSLPTELLLSVVLLVGAVNCPLAFRKSMEYIGNITLPIYLWHIPIQNRILASEYFVNNTIIALFRPVLTIIIMATIISFMKKLSVKTHTDKIFNLVLGVR